MAPTRREFLGAATTSAALGLSGCAGDDGTDAPAATPTDTDAGMAAETDTPTEQDEGSTAAATVAVSTHPEHGEVLVDGDGMTLYMFDRDTQGAGASACTGDCAAAWPPLTADGEPNAGDGVTADLSTFEREDGSTQVAADGWPLYRFADDGAPGDAMGQGVGEVWWVLGPDGTPKRPRQATVQVRAHPDHGEILVDGEGRTLYMFDRDTRGAGESSCTGDCAAAWPPLTTAAEPAAGDGVAAELSTIEREDGSMQVAAGGWPLYGFADDGAPGDAMGQGVGDVWWVLGPDGTPKRPEPASVAVRSHDAHGDILVDGEGMTLYMFDEDSNGEGSSACTGGCADSWPPHTSAISPDVGADVTADVGRFERADGSSQVTAAGWPLYRYGPDTSPGDAEGQGSGDNWWVLSPSGMPKRDVDVGGGGGGGGGGVGY